MSAGGVTVLDGSHLRSLHLSLPDPNGVVTGAQLLEIANSKASSSLFGLSLPENIKASALSRVIASAGDDDVAFRKQELAEEKASKVLSDYISAIADELKGNYKEDQLSQLDDLMIKIIKKD